MKVALITAAGRGIGAGVARELNQRGYQLGLLSPSESVTRLGDELGGILQDFALRLDGCVDALMGERGHALEQHYRQELRRVREEADAAFRAREAALRAELDEDYRRKEQTLRSNYRKLVETANRMKQQKAQLQQARQQFEEKLDAVNALHRKVEDMRRQLRDHLGPEAS